MRPVLFIALALAAGCAHADEPEITPYRPSVSNPANLPAPGQLELEFGGLRQRDGASRRSSTPYLLKLAFNEAWGVLVGGEAWVRADGRQGLGDTSFVLKRAFVLDDEQAFGLELGRTVPSSGRGLGNDKPDTTLTGIYSQNWGALHADVNLGLTRVGGIAPGEGRTQTAYSASFSHPVNESWGLGVEWSGTRRAGTDSTAQALLSLSYSPHKRLTFDIGMARGLNGASGGTSVFGGVVLPLARFW
ncbi:transporter [Massilia sp. TS11]|uniref:transporter n=1 Tax=Massilia sp. TS11 TaxID=2908003 RepID=UPI001EDBD267|nr:transporter [Massilia sp. TS11]MCG2584125.1 transporter [Massilia sp. TS11]